MVLESDVERIGSKTEKSSFPFLCFVLDINKQGKDKKLAKKTPIGRDERAQALAFNPIYTIKQRKGASNALSKA